MSDAPRGSTVASLHAERWRVSDAQAHYHLDAWGGGFFSVNDAGHVQMTVGDGPAIDLLSVVHDLNERGVAQPVLLRFQDILKARVEALNQAFDAARAEHGYAAPYRGVYPIKVNQLHEVVDEILQAGQSYRLGLESGSKAELVAAVALLPDDDGLLICNGYKDDDVLELILDAQALGRDVLPVVEKYDEFVRLRELAVVRKVVPRFGVRLRLNAQSAGHWASSSGDRSKFGVSMSQLWRIVQTLRAAGDAQSLRLVHCHLGSQIPDIMTLAEGVRELAQVYVQLALEDVRPQYLDVGGGLGVNHDAAVGGVLDTSINYTLQEYANTVVSVVAQTCAHAAQPVPTLVSESGRAMTAHHSMLVVPVLGAYGPAHETSEPEHDSAHPQLLALRQIQAQVTEADDVRALLASCHDAISQRREGHDAFRVGTLSLPERAQLDALFFDICGAINARVAAFDTRALPQELLAIRDLMADQYLCNFSVFQSMLDHWAIGQRFPIVPLQRLDECPDRRAVLVDLTCDSDGKVDSYVSHDPNQRTLDVHALRDNEPYYLGFFLMGAYQDIMGDAHNLFGRVSEAHIYADADEPDGYYVEKVLPGASVSDMLEQVQYFANDLQRRMSDLVRQRIERKTLRPRDGAALLDRYRALFDAAPYLVDRRRESSAMRHANDQDASA